MFVWLVFFFLILKYKEDNLIGILCRVNYDNSKYMYNEFMFIVNMGLFFLIF